MCRFSAVHNLYISLKFYTVNTTVSLMGWGNSVVIATCYGMGGPGDRIPVGIFSAPVQAGPWAYPASWIMGTRSLSRGKKKGHGVDHPPNLAPRLEKEWSYNFTSPLGAHGLF
jgi:hypothetical protein